jgi:hypothetical protein
LILVWTICRIWLLDGIRPRGQRARLRMCRDLLALSAVQTVRVASNVCFHGQIRFEFPDDPCSSPSRDPVFRIFEPSAARYRAPRVRCSCATTRRESHARIVSGVCMHRQRAAMSIRSMPSHNARTGAERSAAADYSDDGDELTAPRCKRWSYFPRPIEHGAPVTQKQRACCSSNKCIKPFRLKYDSRFLGGRPPRKLF